MAAPLAFGREVGFYASKSGLRLWGCRVLGTGLERTVKPPFMGLLRPFWPLRAPRSRAPQHHPVPYLVLFTSDTTRNLAIPMTRPRNSLARSRCGPSISRLTPSTGEARRRASDSAQGPEARQLSCFRCAPDSRPDTLRRCRHAAVRPQPILRRHGF